MNTTEHPSTKSARPQPLRLYHPNGSGTGSALQLEPRFSIADADRYNCFFLEMALQKTASRQENGKRVHATFDWEGKLAVKLDFTDICEILAVLEGRADKAGGNRNGLYHQHGEFSTIITCQRGEKGGYLIGLSRKEQDTGEARRINMLLSEAEATGLRALFQGSLFYLTFHQHLFGIWTLHSTAQAQAPLA